MSPELPFLGLTEVAGAIAARKVSSEEVVRACLERIDRLDPLLHFFIWREPEAALAAARAADRQVAAREPLGPLHGVPLAHKDMFYVAGKLSTCGSRIRRDFRPDSTATVMERLEQAGAIHVGGLAMVEFAMGPHGYNQHLPQCRNPWNPDHIPCGSSSGSGVAVGPLARTVRDCARLLGVIAGADPRDATCSAEPVPDYEAALTERLAGVRVGVPRSYFYDGAAEEVRAALRESLRVLESLGAEVVDVDVPASIHEVAELHPLVMKAEGAANHGPWMRERAAEYSDQVRNRLQAGFSIPATDYIQALKVRGCLLDEFLRAVFARVDVLHTPLLPKPVPTRATELGRRIRAAASDRGARLRERDAVASHGAPARARGPR